MIIINNANKDLIFLIDKIENLKSKLIINKIIMIMILSLL
jgi:hypothetical protein